MPFEPCFQYGALGEGSGAACAIGQPRVANAQPRRRGTRDFTMSAYLRLRLLGGGIPTIFVYYLCTVCTIDETLREERRVLFLTAHGFYPVRVFAKLGQFTFQKMPFIFERHQMTPLPVASEIS